MRAKVGIISERNKFMSKNLSRFLPVSAKSCTFAGRFYTKLADNMRKIWTILLLVPAMLMAQNVTLLKQRKFPKTVPAGNYSGITWMGGNRYAVANDKSPTTGFYQMTIEVLERELYFPKK
jgi:hypothetical protein